MVLKPVQLSPDIRRRCWQHGEAKVAHYERGGSPNSRAVSYNGADTNVIFQVQGLMAECVFAVELGLDPDRHVRWDFRPDDGADFGTGFRIDIKATSMRGSRLIWPKGKRHIYQAKHFDALMLVKVDIDHGAGFSVGFVLKEHFFEQKKIADEADPSGLHPGTWYLDASDLYPAAAFLRVHSRRAAA